MRTDDNQSNENSEHLYELCDRLLKAGFIKQHGHTQDRTAVVFTPKGIRAARAITDIENALAPLNHDDRLGIWYLFANSTPPAYPL
jgi:hypothetical protein